MINTKNAVIAIPHFNSSFTIYHLSFFIAVITAFFGGNNRDRTCDPLLVRQMLSQLSYAPVLKQNSYF